MDLVLQGGTTGEPCPALRSAQQPLEQCRVQRVVRDLQRHGQRLQHERHCIKPVARTGDGVERLHRPVYSRPGRGAVRLAM